MAEEKKPSYPMLPAAAWWKLRDKFKQSIPGVVTDNYLATTLNTQARSARVNILPYLKAIGLIEEDGKTNQELAKAWRDDAQYAEVCKNLKERLYPNDLIAAVHNPSEERSAVERWFANKTGTGISAVSKMAAFYIILSEADVSKQMEKKAQKEPSVRKQKSISQKIDTKEPEVKKRDIEIESTSTPQAILPTMHINIEIHISSDATPDQIDKMFESMAKHIYKK
jgi:hypothetical protein